MATNEEVLSVVKKTCGGVGIPFARSALIALCFVPLLGCSSNESKTSSQVAAKVNGQEITVHQVNNQLAHSGIKGETDVKQISKKILDSLIDQELLVQQALENRLDRDPKVMQTIEDAKRQILARAYAERMVYSRDPSTDQEIKDFFKEHPELFAKRKIYEFRTFVVSQASFNEGLKNALDKAKTARETANILQAGAIEFKEEKVRIAAEQVPMELLRAVASMNVGDIVPVAQDNQIAIMQLENAVEEPIDEKRAQVAIEQHLGQSKNQNLLTDKLKQLRASSEITYLGAFDQEQPSASSESKAEKEPTSALTQSRDDYLRKGLAGLK